MKNVFVYNFLLLSTKEVKAVLVYDCLSSSHVVSVCRAYSFPDDFSLVFILAILIDKMVVSDREVVKGSYFILLENSLCSVY